MMMAPVGADNGDAAVVSGELANAGSTGTTMTGPGGPLSGPPEAPAHMPAADTADADPFELFAGHRAAPAAFLHASVGPTEEPAAAIPNPFGAAAVVELAKHRSGLIPVRWRHRQLHPPPTLSPSLYLVVVVVVT